MGLYWKRRKTLLPIKKNVYVAGKIQINEIKKQIENLTSRVIDSTKNIFIPYYYKDNFYADLKPYLNPTERF
jgi:hypothetical protein